MERLDGHKEINTTIIERKAKIGFYSILVLLRFINLPINVLISLL